MSISFNLTFRGEKFLISKTLNSTLFDLRKEIEILTNVEIENQKIIASKPFDKIFNKNLIKKDEGYENNNDDGNENENEKFENLNLFNSNFNNNNYSLNSIIKLMLIGPKKEEIESIKKQDEVGLKLQKPRQYHPSMLKGQKLRNTSKPKENNPFITFYPHKSTPLNSKEYNLIMKRLENLTKDEAILHICKLHDFKIGILTELLPHEFPNLLGLNENMGQKISLRLRTDLYDGLRSYKDVRQVLLHELAHNKINDHPVEFKILNSELNAQVEAFENAKKQGTHHLIQGDIYEPTIENNNEKGLISTENVLGGGGANLNDLDPISKRNQILEATMKRLSKTEEEIEKACGSKV